MSNFSELICTINNFFSRNSKIITYRRESDNMGTITRCLAKNKKKYKIKMYIEGRFLWEM